MRLLIVEDEQKVAMALREGLEGEGYEVTIASTGAEAFSRVNSDTFEIVLLDLTLPERDGLEILTALRQRRLETRVLILTARDTLDDRVKGLDSGADDYLVKPFAFAELLARMRALERRGRMAPLPRLTVHDLAMDMRTRTVTRGSRVIDLTALEFTSGTNAADHPRSTTSSTCTSPVSARKSTSISRRDSFTRCGESASWSVRAHK
ncbi:MAG: DNA-binding response regulator [Acidobacteria bacterium]|nr:MAG: DNA-binding response regulator [Acidobacteriota bacterium]